MVQNAPYLCIAKRVTGLGVYSNTLKSRRHYKKPEDWLDNYFTMKYT